jgi:release factor glutamine methyltransferase
LIQDADTESEVVDRLRAAGCVFAEDEARLLCAEATDDEHLSVLVQRRATGEPLEYLLGWAQFCGLRIVVEPGVFVPRKRTEFLVAQAVVLRPRVMVDLCCGSGAIAAAVLARLGPIEVHAVDVDPAAVRCAKRNVRGSVYEGDLFDPLPSALAGRVDVLVANAPYVPSGSVDLMPREARLYEARSALDGGADGVDVQRRVLAGALHWLAPRGHVLVETSRTQAAAGVRACAAAGLHADVVHSDDHDATVLVATVSGDR